MKNKIAKAGLCVLAAGMLFTASVYAAEQHQEYDDAAAVSTTFWRKRDKENVPGNEAPQPNPAPSPNTAPTGVPKDVPKAAPPKAAPQGAPAEAPAETQKQSPDETGLIRYYNHGNNSSNSGGQNQGQQQQNQGQQQQNQQNQQQQYRQNQGQQQQNQGQQYRQNQGQQQYQQNQQNQNQQYRQNQGINPGQNQSQSGGYYQHNYRQGNPGTGHRISDFMPCVEAEIQKILCKHHSIKLEPDAYIVQHEDGLWLVMGNIRAKLDILIYVDQKNIQEAEFNYGNAVPLYK